MVVRFPKLKVGIRERAVAKLVPGYLLSNKQIEIKEEGMKDFIKVLAPYHGKWV